MIEVVDAAVDWYDDFANLPELKFLVNEEPTPYGDLVWNMLPMPDGGRFFLSVDREPMIQFISESPNGGGALGRGPMKLVTGEEVKPNGGWSSSDAHVNRLRATDERFKALLPEPVVQVTWFSAWDRVGTFGAAWPVSFVLDQVEKYLPGVTMYGRSVIADSEANSQQAAIVYAGVEATDANSGVVYVPWPTDQQGVKPERGSDLHLATSSEVKRAAARSARSA